ncbi:MAG: hypothetical protein ACXVQV_03240 [Actinomycetota bacterium]
MKRTSVARAAAALGVACLLLAPMASAARADSTLPIYQASGIAQGLLTTITLKPSVLDPLIEVGTNYTNTTISSEGGGISHTLAAQAYPGSILVGFIGCGQDVRAWVQAAYPAGGGCKSSVHETLFSTTSTGNQQMDASLKPLTSVTSSTLGDLRASAGEGTGDASIETHRFLLASDPTAPILSIGSMTTSTHSTAVGKTLQNIVTSTAKDVSLMGGVVKIASITSTSVASSDGTKGVAKGTLTFVGASVLASGTRHEISIDNTGIHSTESSLTREQNLALGEQITDLLAQAGIQLTAATPTKIVDGASGEASVGGLVISLDGTVPSVPIPQEIAPVLGQVINQIPTQCLSDFKIPAPICFGPGIVPGLGSEAKVTFTIGSTDAFAVGGLGFGFGPGTGGCSTCSTSPKSVLPTTISAPPVGGSQPQPLSQPALQPRLRLFGLVARLPAIALLWGGATLLVFAVASAFGPSLRHDRAR